MNCSATGPHSRHLAMLIELRQQTAVRSGAVGSATSVHRLLWWMRRPRALSGSGSARLAVSVKKRYGSPVCTRFCRMRDQSWRASTVPRTLPLLGSISCQAAPVRTASMKASLMHTPWCRFSFLRCISPPVEVRISMNSITSGWLMSM